jgi:hypothetical protein
MATANSSYSFSLDGDAVTILPVHPKSGLPTIVIQGLCTDKDGNTFDFVASNNLDLRYADRFKVNWNGSKARMPVAVGLGLGEDRVANHSISDGLFMTRGARIAIARHCIALYPTDRQVSLAASAPVAEVAEVAEESDAS